MSWNVDFSIGGGRRPVERIDERIIVTPGREIIEETITRGPYRERFEETIITGGPRREIIEERVVVGPGRREIIEERVIVDRPGDSYYSMRQEPPPPYSAVDRVHMVGRPVLPHVGPKPFKPVMAGTFIPGRVIHRPQTTTTTTSRNVEYTVRHEPPPPYRVNQLHLVSKPFLPRPGPKSIKFPVMAGTSLPGFVIRPPPSTSSTTRIIVGWAPPSHCRGTVIWMEASNGMVPRDGVHAGIDKDGSTIYAGRAWHHSDLLPAKVTPSHGCAYVSWGGEEIKKYNYEVMICGHIAWVSESNGRVPIEAIPCGHTSDGERLYLGRCMHDGTLTVGKVHPSHNCIYIPYGGREVSHRDYEVLVVF